MSSEQTKKYITIKKKTFVDKYGMEIIEKPQGPRRKYS